MNSSEREPAGRGPRSVPSGPHGGRRIRQRPKGTGVGAVAAAALLVPGLAACGPLDPTGGSETGAEHGGEAITVYSGRNEERVQQLFDQFEEQTGIAVEVRYGDSAEMAAQILEEGDASPADLFFSLEAGGLNALTDAGYIASLPEDVMAPVPEEFRASGGAWVATSARARVIAYNPDLVSADELPDSSAELLDERWQGEIAYAPTNASWQGFVSGLRALEGDDEARDWLTAFRDLDPEPFDNNRAITDAVENGQASIGLTNHYYRITQAEELGEENVGWEPHYVTGGDPLGLINAAGVAVLERSENQQEAFELVKFLLSETAQQYFADETAEYPARDGIESTEHDLVPLSELGAPDLDLASLSSIEETLELLRDVDLL